MQESSLFISSLHSLALVLGTLTLIPPQLGSSSRRRCAQPQHSQVCCMSATLQAPWHCGPGASGSRWAACALFSSCCCPIASAGHQGLALEPPAHPTVSASGFPKLGRLCLILTHQSDWCQMNFLALFLTILGFPRGLREAVVPSRRCAWILSYSDKFCLFPLA